MNITENPLRLNQGVLENLLRISQQYLEDSQPEWALNTLDKFLDAKPENPEALGLRAQSLLDMGRYGEAAEAFAEAIRFAPSPESYVKRARCFRLLAQPAEAMACLDIARLSLGELHVFDLEAMECERDMKKFDAALDRNLRLLKNPGSNAELLEVRGELYSEAGMREEALAAWQQALKSLESLSPSEYLQECRERLNEKIRRLES